MRELRYFTLLGTVVLLLLVAGLLLRRGEILLLIIPILAYLVAAPWLSFSPEEVKLRAQREIAERQLLSCSETTIRVEVLNEGRKLSEVQLLEQLPPGLIVIEGETRLITTLGPGERAELVYRACAERGRFEFSGIKARVADSLGFNLLELDLPCHGELLFTPRCSELRDITIAPRRTKVYSGIVKARLGGTGVEFFGTREYYQGDEFRWIDWNATARLGRLITTEFEQERVADVGLVLDARARADIVIGGESLFEYSVRATASLARYFIKEGNRVGLLIYGRYLDWTFPGYGRLQLVKLMEALTSAEQGDKAIFAGLENIPRRLFPAGSQLVLIGRLLEQDIEVLRRLRALYSVIVVSPDPLEFEWTRLPERSGAAELARRIAWLRRELMFNELREVGVRVVNWQTGQPLRGAAKEALSRAPCARLPCARLLGRGRGMR